MKDSPAATPAGKDGITLWLCFLSARDRTPPALCTVRLRFSHRKCVQYWPPWIQATVSGSESSGKWQLLLSVRSHLPTLLGTQETDQLTRAEGFCFPNCGHTRASHTCASHRPQSQAGRACDSEPWPGLLGWLSIHFRALRPCDAHQEHGHSAQQECSTCFPTPNFLLFLKASKIDFGLHSFL